MSCDLLTIYFNINYKNYKNIKQKNKEKKACNIFKAEIYIFV